MFAKRIDNIYLEPKGTAVIRDRNGWQLEIISNKGEKRQTFRQLATTGKLETDSLLFPFLDQPAKVIEGPSCEGCQILDIYMRWEV